MEKDKDIEKLATNLIEQVRDTIKGKKLPDRKSEAETVKEKKN
jgi:hypothetical protein